MSEPKVALYEFMPYGAPELLEVAKKYLTRALTLATGALVLVFVALLGLNYYLSQHQEEVAPIVVPYRELQAPPPLTDAAPPPQVQVATQVAPPAAAIPVPVPDAEAPQEQTIASQEELSAVQGSSTVGDGDNIVVAPPQEDALPGFGEYVYTDELPEKITHVQPVYPDIAREAGVDGTVMVQALVGKDGRVKDVRVVKSIPMLDAAAIQAVKGWVFKPALSNNKPVAVWVGCPVKFSLH
ncbi:MAG: energy transducer TonB [Candidatus Eisenbacteria bacterium]|nr:energy transducer TonB [Candidatus Eisenbacteria bacterium]